MGAAITIITETESQTASDSHCLPLLRMLQIASANLPVGAFSYSQGLESAIDAGWIDGSDTMSQWLVEQLQGVMTYQELPLLKRLYEAFKSGSMQEAIKLSEQVIAYRETAELRDEERQRGRAMAKVVQALHPKHHKIDALPSESANQLYVFAGYCYRENLKCSQTLSAYTYMWLESLVIAAIKLVPLGQTDAQVMIYETMGQIGDVCAISMQVADDEIGYSSPAVAMASSLHETQYSRLFRS